MHTLANKGNAVVVAVLVVVVGQGNPVVAQRGPLSFLPNLPRCWPKSLREYPTPLFCTTTVQAGRQVDKMKCSSWTTGHLHYTDRLVEQFT